MEYLTEEEIDNIQTDIVENQFMNKLNELFYRINYPYNELKVCKDNENLHINGHELVKKKHI
jgi:hypothetical protein